MKNIFQQMEASGVLPEIDDYKQPPSLDPAFVKKIKFLDFLFLHLFLYSGRGRRSLKAPIQPDWYSGGRKCTQGVIVI